MCASQTVEEQSQLTHALPHSNSHNTASGEGGGLYAEGSAAQLANVTVTYNSAVSGGKSRLQLASHMLESRLTSNCASGGLAVFAADLTMADVHIGHNQASFTAGGMLVDLGGHATMGDGVVVKVRVLCVRTQQQPQSPTHPLTPLTQHNEAACHGGGMVCQASTLTSSVSQLPTFMDNEAVRASNAFCTTCSGSLSGSLCETEASK